jgi:tetratricopeptide (TPR) repeat protein
VLAHHLTAAGRAEVAIPLWQAAGDLASKRMALVEAIAHLNRGLEVVAKLPPSLERDAGELELRRCLGAAWRMLRGWGAPEVWTSLHPAPALAKSLRRHDALAQILLLLGGNVQQAGRITEALQWGQEMLDLAAETGDADLWFAAQMRACANNYHAGNFVKSIEHADRILERYDAAAHRRLLDTFGHDPKTVAGSFASISTWILGFPDRASQIESDKNAHARWLGHPFNLGQALTEGAFLFDDRFDIQLLYAHADELDRTGRENSLPYLRTHMAHGLRIIALRREGKLTEMIAPLKVFLRTAEAARGGSTNCGPLMRSGLA